MWNETLPFSGIPEKTTPTGHSITFHRSMCWSAPVTTLFLTWHLGTALIVNGVYNGRYRWAFLSFLCFYAAMEFLQLLQWTYTTPYTDGLFTFCAYLLIWCQPVMFSLIGVYQSLDPIYEYNLSFSLCSLSVALINLFASLYTGISVVVSNTPTNFRGSLCTTIGKYGHLSWGFPIYSLDLQPSYFVYLFIIGVCIYKFPRPLQLTLGLGWFTTLLVSIYLVRGSEEIPAFWCLLSVFTDIPILGYVMKNRNARVMEL